MFSFALFGLLALSQIAFADDGLAAWLRYAPLPGDIQVPSMPSQIIALNKTRGNPVLTAGLELQQGMSSILSKHCSVTYEAQISNSIVVGTLQQYQHAYGPLPNSPELVQDGFWLNNTGGTVQILGQNERGALYGAFEYLSMIAQGNFSKVAYASNPDAPIRWTNEWDNLDSSIERGFAGASIFFNNGAIVANLTRAAQYARLLASIGVNAVVVNNVNANATSLTPANIEGLGRIADAFRPYGVQVGLSLYFSSPTQAVQGRRNLTTFDPLDQSVIQWWTDVTNDIYRRIPDMAGYLVKANSEGQPGPITYNRTLAQGANLFAKVVQPHGGIVMFRAFVYDQLNESDWRADRANAADEFFDPLDGDFDENVVVQIKYGPIDFQVREPASPLFANLRKTSTAIELQVTQEYLGQQCHLVYLPPLWQTVLGFDMKVDDRPSLVRDIISGTRFNRSLGGYAGVVNVGTNTTWLGSHLAMSNLYAYGRLAWNPTLDSVSILQAWTRLTFGFDPSLLATLTDMSMTSWPAYENYTGNLGVQTLTDILYTHFGPNPQTQDNTGWGQWTRADAISIGMDRTISNGTAFSGKYPPQISTPLQNPSTTPENLLLWFHHLPYTYLLPSTNTTIIQSFYDAHYSGALTISSYAQKFLALASKIDPQRYTHILNRLVYQSHHAITWRDAITTFYHHLSSIPDAHNRVNNHPHRIEAETMKLTNYKTYAVSPFEVASNATAIVTTSNSTTGVAEAQIPFESGRYDVGVNYFDLYGGEASYEVWIAGKRVGSWKADSTQWVDGRPGPAVLGHTPSVYLDGHSAMRIVFEGMEVRKGDGLRVVGKADGDEPAPLDYVVFLPSGEGVVD